MDLKLLKINRVFHVGSLDISKKVEGSYEGSGLSVSNCPEAWRKINKGMTYGDTWNIKKEKGGLFVDYHDTMCEEFKEVLKLWGMLNGYLTGCLVYSIEVYDDELGSYYNLNFLNKEDAEIEADMYDTTIIESTGVKSTVKMLKEIKYSLKGDLINPYDLLFTLYVEKSFEHIDGIWWEDSYMPECYSAPRGVIFNSKLKEWDCFVGEDTNFESGCQDILDFEEDYMC